MIQKINIPVSVIFAFNHKTRSAAPKKVLFEGREYNVTRVGFHHTFREGRTLFHVFSAVSETMFFRLVLDTDTLAWRAEEISDGEPN